MEPQVELKKNGMSQETGLVPCAIQRLHNRPLELFRQTKFYLCGEFLSRQPNSDRKDQRYHQQVNLF